MPQKVQPKVQDMVYCIHRQLGLELLFSPLFPIGAIVVLSGIGVGAMAGGLYGASQAVPEETAKMIEQKLNEKLNAVNLSIILADRVYATSNARSNLKKYNILRLSSSESQEGLPYSEYANLGVDNILLLKVTEAGFFGGEGEQPEVRVYMIVRTQVISTDDGAVIFERDFDYQSETLPFDEWFSESEKKLKLEIDRAQKSLSERIVDDMFIYFIDFQS